MRLVVAFLFLCPVFRILFLLGSWLFILMILSLLVSVLYVDGLVVIWEGPMGAYSVPRATN